MSGRWPKISNTYTRTCPGCSKPGDVSCKLDEHGLRDRRDSYMVVHKIGADGYPDLFWNEVVCSCGPFRWNDIPHKLTK